MATIFTRVSYCYRQSTVTHEILIKNLFSVFILAGLAVSDRGGSYEAKRAVVRNFGREKFSVISLCKYKLDVDETPNANGIHDMLVVFDYMPKVDVITVHKRGCGG